MNHYHSLLRQFVAIPSVSTDPAFIPQCQATAEALAEWLTKIGFEAALIPTSTQHPLVLARYAPFPDAPTCLIYGHYDVQPAVQADGWSQDPFTLQENGDYLVGRGSTDNKGQFLIHLATIAELISTNRLAWNIEVLIEGDEENGSEAIVEFLTSHPERITATTALISDGELHDLQPQIGVGFRGTVQMNVQLRTSDRDLHSGIFGGTVPNAAHELVRLLTTLHHADGSLAVANITEGAHQPTPEEQAWADLGTNPATYPALTGTKTHWHPSSSSLGSQLIFQPTIEIIGLSSGYMGEGFRNSISATAAAKLNVRTVPGQDAQTVFEHIKNHLTTNCPEYAELTVEHDTHGAGTLVDATAPVLQYVRKQLTATYGKEPEMSYCGASLPFLAGFQAVPGLALAIVPLANDDCLMHAVGENIALANIEKGLAFSEAFFSSIP